MFFLQIDTVTNQASYFATQVKEMAIQYAPKLVGAILVYLGEEYHNRTSIISD